MDLFDLLLHSGLITIALVGYLIFFRRSSPIKFKGNYREPAWNYPLRVLIAQYAVKQWKSRLSSSGTKETPREDQKDGWDTVSVKASSPDGATVFLRITKLCDKTPVSEVTVFVDLGDGTSYKSRNPALSPWESISDGWCGGGLKIQVLEPESRLRITFNGLLNRVGDNQEQHVRFNFIWASATSTVRYPEDWSNELAAQALALEPWRDGKWPLTLGKWGQGNWLQFGTVQGRFLAYDSEGASDRSEYLELRGVRERSWSPQGYQGLRRTLSITVAAKDGTAVQLNGFSYKDVLTVGFSGSVRFPDFTVKSITDTDLVLCNFCEHPDGIPNSYTINVSTKNRVMQLVLRINARGGKLLNGIQVQHEVTYRTLVAGINGEQGTGLLELGYEAPVKYVPPLDLFPPRMLRWLSEKDAGNVGYCLQFEEPAAACPNYVGGKGASLALLASAQKEQGYRVPPGYCLTTKAFEGHLDKNPALKSAIADIEAANENYDEKVFKDKCAKTAELFTSTDIAGELKTEILAHLSELRKKAIAQNLGPDLRFAVRSSAVGEDGEALSAAGQNETVLGCGTNEEVVRGVQRCWGSMFAFTSAYYRRQNGQACFCGASVVIQALVIPRVAGVMFTRHPEAGDPSRLIITANYGLGESVVSGSVEPDTITIKRGEELTISKTELGTKTQRVTTASQGVTTEDVPDEDRKVSCVTREEALELARIGVQQERLWGSGRDIEWAISQQGDIFLLQARPITSLERWTEEELLHELDFPIMADDELITFANCGEVLPKPLTALSYDFVYTPLWRGINAVMYGTNDDGYDKSVIMTHNRVALALYNSVYRRVPTELDMTIRMLEISIHGHKVADDSILSSALHRRQTSRLDNFLTAVYTLRYLLTTKSRMHETIDIVDRMSLDVNSASPGELLESLAAGEDILYRCACNHSSTTTASTSSQFIAMMVLVEGGSEFTLEQCNEVNTLLSAGGVLSAEVPQALASIARKLDASGKVDEFRAQDPKNAICWLKENLPNVHQDICQFLEHHGHRAIMEFDLATKPWVLVPEEMMEVLQNMRTAPPQQENQVTKSNAEIVSLLKTPKKSSTRKVLRWVLPLCQRTVRHREITKAQLILGIHKLRIGFLHLARVLVRQWYLPDEDLVFHFRLHELREYIATRNPALLKKAAQRRQFYPSWSKLRFSEMHKGWVRPLQRCAPPLTNTGDVTLRATSVCGGEVVARACVVHDLAEIGQLQRGDVLITHSTDIGWSPYFPLLSGIVTELGGLISHGAVIAREYGLPCIVGAVHATDLFRTGDMVRLSGTNGLIERVTLADNTGDD